MAAVPNEPLGTAVAHMIDITGMDAKYVAGYTHRKYCTKMPTGYDHKNAYPIVFYGPGCGAVDCEGSSFNGRTDILFVQAIPSADVTLATVVPPAGRPGCFQTDKVSTVDSPELNYFDQVMAEVGKKYCVDKGRIFAAGIGSGGSLTNYLACARGGVIRGAAAGPGGDGGGIPFDHPPCTGGAGVIEITGSYGNFSVKDYMGREIGPTIARDMFIVANGCSKTPTQMVFGNDTCDFYGGCDSPVAWCGGANITGLDSSHLPPTGWAFWSTLK
jgi:hypothetical protein